MLRQDDNVQMINNAGGGARLEADGLVFQVEGKRLLDSVSLRAGKGEFIGLIGPNGAGKTTFLKALLRLLRPQQGAVLLDGSDIHLAPVKQLARSMALVPQGAPNTFGFTSIEVTIMGRYPHLSRFQIEGRDDRRIALEAMALTGTEAFADRVLATLSGGERQRVFVARAIAQQPSVLLMDEPVSNLDVRHQCGVLDAVRGLVSQGITAIAAMHDLSLAARYCDRLVLLDRGRITADGPPEEVLTSVNLRAVFGVSAVIYRDPFTDRLSISLMDKANSGDQKGTGRRVHLVCGSGSGVRLMCELKRGGHAVTACTLGAGDTDRMAAELLGVPFVPVPAFSPIDDESHNRHLQLVATADCAVLCDVPFGVNNLRNLEALAAARSVISLADRPFSLRDFAGGEATKLYQALAPKVRCHRIDEMPQLLRQLQGGPADG